MNYSDSTDKTKNLKTNLTTKPLPLTASTVLNLSFRQYQRTPTDHPYPEKSNIGFEAADQDVAEEAGGGTNGKGTSRSSIFVSVIEA